MRASLLVLTLFAAGCYSPGLQPCAIACSANRECPDGLACNAQNACATTSTAMCDELPVDAPEMDSATSSVTIEVRDRIGGPLASATVVFADGSGALIRDVRTGVDGKATADVPPGGSATVVRVIQNMPTGMVLHATTYLDLWPGAHIIAQAELDQRMRSVTINASPPSGASVTAVHTSCSGYVQGPGPVDVPLRCPTFDVIVTATDLLDSTRQFAAVVAAQSGPTVMVPLIAFKQLESLPGMLLGLPSNASNRFINLSGWATPALPAPNKYYLASANLPPSGAFGPVLVPRDAGLQTQLVVSHQPVAGGPMSQQIVLERLQPTVPTINRDYNSTLVPWVGSPMFDPASRRMSWPFFVPASTVPATPNLFAATVSYTREGTPVIWRLTGDASRIVTTGALQSITYPEVPGMGMLGPTSMDVVSMGTIVLLGTEAAAVRDLRQILEPEGSDSGYFKVPSLRHVTISVGQ